MSAEERLRRYLEQRREMGESELVLDAMTVDDVMKMLGAARTREAGRAREAAPVAPASHEAASRPTTPGPAGSQTALPAESAGPIAEAKPPAAEESSGDAASRPSNSPKADWREQLRAAGAGPGKPSGGTRRPGEPRPHPDREKEPQGMEQSPAPGAAATPSGNPSKAPEPAPVAASATRSLAPNGISVGVTGRQLFGGPFAGLESLGAIAETVAKCTRCPLYATATNPVPGEGNPNADLVVVGEAPGANEDASGRPFVGAAGQLLTKILEAINLRREDVFICNVLKHRPPDNRNPLPNEVEACSPYLVRQIELIRPKVILALGLFAAQTLLNSKLPLIRLRESVHQYYGIPLIVTYHPAALLRNPNWKRPTWEDVKLARRILDSRPSADA